MKNYSTNIIDNQGQFIKKTLNFNNKKRKYNLQYFAKNKYNLLNINKISGKKLDNSLIISVYMFEKEHTNLRVIQC